MRHINPHELVPDQQLIATLMARPAKIDAETASNRARLLMDDQFSVQARRTADLRLAGNLSRRRRAFDL